MVQLPNSFGLKLQQNAEVRIAGYCKHALVQTLVGLGRHEAVRAVWSASTSEVGKKSTALLCT